MKGFWHTFFLGPIAADLRELALKAPINFFSCHVEDNRGKKATACSRHLGGGGLPHIHTGCLSMEAEGSWHSFGNSKRVGRKLIVEWRKITNGGKILSAPIWSFPSPWNFRLTVFKEALQKISLRGKNEIRVNRGSCYIYHCGPLKRWIIKLRYVSNRDIK